MVDDQTGVAFSTLPLSVEPCPESFPASAETESAVKVPKRALGSPWPWSVPGLKGHYKTRAEAILAAVEGGEDTIVYQPPEATTPKREQIWVGDVIAARRRIAGRAGSQTMMLLVTPLVARIYASRHPLTVPAKATVPGWHVFNVADARNLLADAETRRRDPEQCVADAFERLGQRIRGTMTRLGFPVHARAA